MFLMDDTIQDASAPSAGADVQEGFRQGMHEKLEALLASAEQLLVLSGRSAARSGTLQGLRDDFARYAADHLFSEIDELGVRDGANLVVAGYDFAPSFSIWTTIEECLNPPVVWERNRGWYTTEPVWVRASLSEGSGVGISAVTAAGASQTLGDWIQQLGH